MYRIFNLVLVLCIFVGFTVTIFAECPSSDLTGDCYVDLADLAKLSWWWLATCNESNNWCEGSDYLQSGYVNINTLTGLASYWQTGNRLPEMIFIPGGTFQMGDDFHEGNSNELPVHSVSLSPFFMSRYEITNGQYREFLNSTLNQGQIEVINGVVFMSGSGTHYCDTYSSNHASQIAYSEGVFSVRTKGERDMFNDPMILVNWYGAAAYCNWLSLQEGRQPCYDLSTGECDFSNNGYHLPTEAQWEYAARGGHTEWRFPWGNTITHSQANYYSSSSYSYDISSTPGDHPVWNDSIYPYTSPVGSFVPNDYGLSDMAGNVWEWCNDWYGNYSSSSQTDPTGPSIGTDCVLRGGGWYYFADGCRVSYRLFRNPGGRYNNGGFRVSISDQNH